jgi:hypothetical protein
MNNWPTKDPNEVLDYSFDWTDRLLASETISVSTFERAEGDVVVGAASIAGGITTVWLSGGTAGLANVITNRIVTNQGRTYDESARVRVREK